ncbi:MAG: biotin--[acetyl-CoA-carboxylase] ligase [Comamonadaceae bacterium]|nr:MAG: biotin--[acetyl-CoA-carboxylase] ligase [Comamonadaceae bacterium]
MADVKPFGWPAEAIWEGVYPLLPGFSVEVVTELDSTNSELMRRARDGRAEPTLLVAERQTAGRGRLGRDWQSGAGESLTFSLGLPLSPPEWSGLSLAVGVCVAECLHPDVRLKWPNDLWLCTPDGDRKLGGILVETAGARDGRYAVIGVGINIRPRDGTGMSTPPAAMHALDPGATAPGVLERIALPLVRTVLAFAQTGFAPFQARFQARDALRGRQVSAAAGPTEAIEGTASGVAENGALLVHTALGMKKISSSEVSVRPVAGMAARAFPAAATGDAPLA